MEFRDRPKPRIVTTREVLVGSTVVFDDGTEMDVIDAREVLRVTFSDGSVQSYDLGSLVTVRPG